MTFRMRTSTHQLWWKNIFGHFLAIATMQADCTVVVYMCFPHRPHCRIGTLLEVAYLVKRQAYQQDVYLSEIPWREYICFDWESLSAIQVKRKSHVVIPAEKHEVPSRFTLTWNWTLSNAVLIKAFSIISLLWCYCLIIKFTNSGKAKFRDAAARRLSVVKLHSKVAKPQFRSGFSSCRRCVWLPPQREDMVPMMPFSCAKSG